MPAPSPTASSAISTPTAIYLTGRQSELIVSGGVNIYPAEVEAALLAGPGVRDAAVVGEPDPEFGERVLAYVEPLDPSFSADALGAELDSACRARLAGFKRPRRYVFVAATPRDEAGKLRTGSLPMPAEGRI